MCGKQIGTIEREMDHAARLGRRLHDMGAGLFEQLRQSIGDAVRVAGDGDRPRQRVLRVYDQASARARQT